MRSYIALALIAATTSAVVLQQDAEAQFEGPLKPAEDRPEREQGDRPERKERSGEDRDGGCKGFDGLRDDVRGFWKNFINSGFLMMMEKEEDWVDPCQLPEDWTIEDVPEEHREDVEGLAEEEIQWIRDLCKLPKGSDDRVVGMMQINDYTDQE